jgi:hypothetical protein
MKALNRHVEREFNPDAKGAPLGKTEAEARFVTELFADDFC